jgi:hypothetical protein
MKPKEDSGQDRPWISKSWIFFLVAEGQVSESCPLGKLFYQLLLPPAFLVVWQRRENLFHQLLLLRHFSSFGRREDFISSASASSAFLRLEEGEIKIFCEIYI